jgi:hypothetical protein
VQKTVRTLHHYDACAGGMERADQRRAISDRAWHATRDDADVQMLALRWMAFAGLVSTTHRSAVGGKLARKTEGRP